MSSGVYSMVDGVRRWITTPPSTPVRDQGEAGAAERGDLEHPTRLIRPLNPTPYLELIGGWIEKEFPQDLQATEGVPRHEPLEYHIKGLVEAIFDLISSHVSHVPAEGENMVSLETTTIPSAIPMESFDPNEILKEAVERLTRAYAGVHRSLREQQARFKEDEQQLRKAQQACSLKERTLGAQAKIHEAALAQLARDTKNLARDRDRFEQNFVDKQAQLEELEKIRHRILERQQTLAQAVYIASSDRPEGFRKEDAKIDPKWLEDAGLQKEVVKAASAYYNFETQFLLITATKMIIDNLQVEDPELCAMIENKWLDDLGVFVGSHPFFSVWRVPRHTFGKKIMIHIQTVRAALLVDKGRKDLREAQERFSQRALELKEQERNLNTREKQLEFYRNQLSESRAVADGELVLLQEARKEEAASMQQLTKKEEELRARYMQNLELHGTMQDTAGLLKDLLSQLDEVQKEVIEKVNALEQKIESQFRTREANLREKELLLGQLRTQIASTAIFAFPPKEKEGDREVQEAAEARKGIVDALELFDKAVIAKNEALETTLQELKNDILELVNRIVGLQASWAGTWKPVIESVEKSNTLVANLKEAREAVDLRIAFLEERLRLLEKQQQQLDVHKGFLRERGAVLEQWSDWVFPDALYDQSEKGSESRTPPSTTEGDGVAAFFAGLLRLGE